MMTYLIVLVFLFALASLYFQAAGYFRIFDHPNERSSHKTITLRGGGIVFYLALLIYFFISGFAYPWFFLGLTMISGISFLDDVLTLSNKLRLVVHVTSVGLMAHQLELLSMPWFYLLVSLVVVVGVINAYNFMDGINGITASYSLAVGTGLLIINHRISFIDQDFLIYTLLGVFVFAFYNFRTEAKCFAGDVGSVAIAYILTFALGALILKTGNLLYILLLSIYGIDAVWTIIRRLYLRQNIFEPHRSHLYQFLVNEAGMNKLLISMCYGIVQFLIALAVIYISSEEADVQIMFALVLLIVLSLIYLLVKSRIIRKYLPK